MKDGWLPYRKKAVAASYATKRDHTCFRNLGLCGSAHHRRPEGLPYSVDAVVGDIALRMADKKL